jgi:hypothetical protein
MFIHEMTEDECGAALEQMSFGRLACARDNHPTLSQSTSRTIAGTSTGLPR